ncbi:MAG: lysine--tRNA ligase [Elusimicrobiota bacterium]
MSKKQEQIEIRKSKLADLRNRDVNPYPESFQPRVSSAEALDMDEGKRVRVAGRILSKRVMGKSSFVHIKDSEGKIQIFFSVNKLGIESYSDFKNTDIGDFIGVEGELFITRTGEKTVMASGYVMLGKSLRPLPEKWHGLRDIEKRYRMRYLDMLVNPPSSKTLKARSAILESLREVLKKRKFIEVQTPILQDVAGGAAAKPFTTLHNVYNTNLYMRIAPELYLKRLLVGGWERVFEIGSNFRNEGLSAKHNPEFTMMEIYSAYTDYKFMMKLARELIVSSAEKLKSKGFNISESIFNEWSERDYWQLLSSYTGEEFSCDMDFEQAKRKADKLNVPPGKDSKEKVLDRIFSQYVEPELVKPTFVTGYLSSSSPLAKQTSGNSDLAQRFEIFINGMELGNAYSEQNDPETQRKVLEKQSEENNMPVDEDFIKALEYGMPPASGLGIGIDRLAMILTGAENIREVILFPMLKPLGSENKA